MMSKFMKMGLGRGGASWDENAILVGSKPNGWHELYIVNYGFMSITFQPLGRRSEGIFKRFLDLK